MYNPAMPSRERTFRVEAVVLRHSDWGEADRLLSLYSREQGKLRAVAKGVRKVRSRKAGHLEPFTRVSLLLPRGRDLPLVTQAEARDAYLPLREDLLLVGYASYVVELIDRFTYEGEENRSLYRVLVDTLGRLAAEHEAELVVRYYEIRLLDLLGFRPHLFHCANCEREIQPEDQYFSAELGGVLCPDCGRGRGGAGPGAGNPEPALPHLPAGAQPEQPLLPAPGKESGPSARSSRRAGSLNPFLPSYGNPNPPAGVYRVETSPERSHLEQTALIQRARLGDQAAWMALVGQHQQAVFRLAYLILGDPDDAEDVAQETFIRAYRWLERFDERRPLRPWLLCIAANLSRNQRRAFGRYWAALTRFGRSESEGEGMSPQAANSNPEEPRALWEAVRRLRQADQTVIYLR